MGLNYAPEPTGIAPYTTRLAERLSEAGHDVHVLTGYPHYPHWKLQPGYRGWQRHEHLNGVSVHRYRQSIPRKVTNFSRLHMELSFGIRLISAQWRSPDVILVVTPALFSTGLVMLRARLGSRKPAIGVWVQDIYSRGLEETATGGSQMVRLVQRLEGKILTLADRVSVIHDRFKSYLVSTLEVPDAQVQVIRNWTHIPPAAPSYERQNARASFGWSSEDLIVLHAGNMGLKQGLENVVDAARIATTRNSNIKFVLLGDGNQRPQLMEAAAGVDNISFIPPLPDEDFYKVLGAADILLVNELSGLREMAVPSKLTSYFSTGLPVVAATDPDSTTAGEVLISGGGIIVEPGNPEALIDSITALHEDTELSEQLGKAGRIYSETRLSEDAAIVLYAEWLQDIAAGRACDNRVATKIG